MREHVLVQKSVDAVCVVIDGEAARAVELDEDSAEALCSLALLLDYLALVVEIREYCTYVVGVQLVCGDVRVVFEAGADGGGDGRRED